MRSKCGDEMVERLGNSAAMREALTKISESGTYALKYRHEGLDYGDLQGFIKEMVEDARAALSEPARNCDRPECETSKAAQDVWRKEDGGKTPYYEWLFAPAAERKGDAKVSCDGKMYNKYKIEHTNGTPLKGKKYFVLRLDSDDPIDAARVVRAMRAYEGKLRNCDVGTAEEQTSRLRAVCNKFKPSCSWCKYITDLQKVNCWLAWSQMPYEAEEGGAK